MPKSTMKQAKFWIVSFIFILVLGQGVASIPVELPSFSRGELDQWQQESFDGQTTYQLKQIKDKQFLEALSEQSASILYFPVEVDLTQTPVLNWSWAKQLTIDPGDETQKQGDDFVARVYVVKKGGLLFWNTRAINYVWSAQQPKNSVWNNPFAGDKAKMLAVRDAQDAGKTWYVEKRNILEDFKQLHGKEIKDIDGVAIMTDSDNSGLSAKAYYGDLYFTAE
ncbi:MAG: DUF3047 domain-containing protein [Gammaproteobacteria bacterium]|nr:DUF3047 domain-containing protein [Gammaproteobacteria bacterium]